MKWLTFIFLLIVLFSCDSERLYEQDVDFENRIWPKDSMVSFDFPIDDTSKPYRLLFKIRNTANYQFYNLYIKYTLMYGRDTIANKLEEFHLFDPKTGKPFGSGTGGIYDHRMPFLDSIYFESPGDYTMYFRQYMRQDSLQEILSTGLRLEAK